MSKIGENIASAIRGGIGLVSVFVYGTLLTGENNHFVAKPYVQHVQPGAVHGRLYDVGDYPALQLAEEGIVEGEWLEVTEEGLQAMDELEWYFGPGHPDNEYERSWVRDMSGAREGWVYHWPERPKDLPRIDETSWKTYRKRKST
ncbi:gamma-glutamylcyclotransferase family protein [Paenibacillus ferrarius]|uniref:gamma-glutamylcyclotransferase family protein n=1 Tax=Paenibacillus ferrarius TaxID=1469647 RepID=UPI003D2E40D3